MKTQSTGRVPATISSLTLYLACRSDSERQKLMKTGFFGQGVDKMMSTIGERKAERHLLDE